MNTIIVHPIEATTPTIVIGPVTTAYEFTLAQQVFGPDNVELIDHDPDDVSISLKFPSVRLAENFLHQSLDFAETEADVMSDIRGGAVVESIEADYDGDYDVDYLSMFV